MTSTSLLIDSKIREGYRVYKLPKDIHPGQIDNFCHAKNVIAEVYESLNLIFIKNNTIDKNK